MIHYSPCKFWVVLSFIMSVLFLACVTKNSQPMDVSFTHLGTMNYKHWGLCSFFGVTNKSNFSVKRWPAFCVEDQKTGISSIVMYQENRYFEPGEGETIVIQKPTNQGPWRLVLNYSRNGMAGSFAEILGKYNWSKYLPLRLRAVPSDNISSDWVKDE